MEGLGKAVEELLHELSSLSIGGETVGATSFVLTNYMFFMMIALALTFFLIMFAARRAALVPQGRVANAIEYGYEFVRDSIGGEIMGPKGRPYVPFVATIFFFILFNNLLGLIPGCKPGTGTIGITAALAIAVFLVFNVIGIRNQGVVGYLKGLVPHGVPWWIAWLIWIIEFVSMMIRPVTLAVRLFANMYAGHIILGVFAILTHLAVEPLIEHISSGSVASALPAVVWIALMTSLYALELLVAFVQAYVFTLLSAVYINGALESH